MVKNAGDLGSIPGLGRSPGGENGNPLHYSCLENSMDRLQSIGASANSNYILVPLDGWIN